MHEKMNTSSADRIRKAAARYFSTKNIDYDVPPPSPGFSQVSFAANVFERSFEGWLGREQSFKYFSDVLVRHSLFRPPHSVCIFDYE